VAQPTQPTRDFRTSTGSAGQHQLSLGVLGRTVGAVPKVRRAMTIAAATITAVIPASIGADNATTDTIVFPFTVAWDGVEKAEL
jgi:hypothetical protein